MAEEAANKNFLDLLFYAVSAENGAPSEGRSLSQLYIRTQQTLDAWNPVESLLQGQDMEKQDAFEHAVAMLADVFEQQGFMNGFRMGMMLREELDVSKLDTGKEKRDA